MKGLCIAVRFLTRLPAPGIRVSDEEFAASMRWFPLVGVIIGALIAAAGWAASHVDAWTGALVALVTWVFVTGALHLDGLGDVADAAGAAHKSRDRVLAVLADPHLGSFGVTAIALQLLAKLVLLHALIEHGAFVALVDVPFAARIAPLFWTRWIEPLHDGLGARFRGAIRPLDLGLWTLALLGAVVLHPALIAAIPAGALWGRWLVCRIGGISGDGHGAGIELIEVAVLASLCVETVL